VNLRGSMVALVTPFKKNKVDYKVFEQQVDYQIEAGSAALIPCGTTGESPTLTHAEHKEVIRACVRFSAGKVPVIAGAGSNSTEEALNLTRFAKKAGADAVLSVVPYYNKPTQEGLYRHFKTLAVKGGLPIILYNIPGRCGTALTTSTIVRLAELDNIVGIKEATGSMDQATEILIESDITVLSGDDSLTLPLLSLGAKGVISVCANIFPKEVAHMIKAFFQGHLGLAQDLHCRMYPLIKTLFIETNPIPVKAAMRLMGRDTGDLRPPLYEMKKSNALLLKKAIQNFKKGERIKL
jgi:4-hydroxy-tetrahydrodipicolinate synthase